MKTRPNPMMRCFRWIKKVWSPLIVLVWATVSPADAAVGPNGQIAYSVYENGFYDIWVINADGTGQANITNTPDVSETDPAWSPDGLKIAFTRDDGFGSEIYVMNADGSGQTNLTNSPESDFMADWAPDGTQLTFVRLTAGVVITTQFDIFTMNADGTNPVNITNSDTDELEPAWSPDGARIAIAGVRDGDWEILTMNPDGSGETILTVATQEDRAPSWSPDGTMITFMSQFDEPCCGDWEIWAMNRDGSGGTNLTNDPAGDIYPSWSPDGTQITFSSNRVTSYSLDLFAMPAPTSLSLAPLSPVAAGATATQLTHNVQASQADWGTRQGAAWSYTLAVTKSGKARGLVRSSPAGIRCGRDCSEAYPAGTVVTLTARAPAGSTFAGWGGACSGLTLTCTLTMDGPKAVTATFNASGP